MRVLFGYPKDTSLQAAVPKGWQRPSLNPCCRGIDLLIKHEQTTPNASFPSGFGLKHSSVRDGCAQNKHLKRNSKGCRKALGESHALHCLREV